MNQTINYKDFDKICRLCLKLNTNDLDSKIQLNESIIISTTINSSIIDDENVGNIFKQEQQEHQTTAEHQQIIEEENISKMIFNLTNLEINNSDNLPKSICTECLNQILISYAFRQKCIASTELLQKIIFNYLVNKIPEDENINYFNKDTDLIEHVENFVPFNVPDHDQQPENISSKNMNIHEEQIIVLDQSQNNINKVQTQTRSQRLCNNNNNNKLINIDKIRKERRKMNNRNKKSLQVCPICGDLRKDLRAHMLTHNDDKPFKCNLCGKKVKTAGSLRRHLGYHKEERPHHCTLCSQSFKTLQTLKRHMLTHVSERKYQCDFCIKSFKQKTSRDVHHLTHTQERKYKCEFCDKTFLSSGALRSHIGIHTGERPYKCGFCPLTFTNTSSASVHRRIHLKDDKKYKCDICPMEFDFINIYKGHVLNHEFSNNLIKIENVVAVDNVDDPNMVQETINNCADNINDTITNNNV